MSQAVLKDIIEVLKNDPDPKQFCKTAELEISKIDIVVEGIGQIKFPITEELIKSLIKISTKAKFGKQKQTILDETVRNTQVIDGSKLNVNIDNASMTSMLNKMRSAMGLQENRTLVPHLHNMLVYGPGQFFDLHQDTEKLDDMIATLVIILPHPHIGGNLVIKNKLNSDKSFTYSSQTVGSSTKAKCIAFYADCLHKIEKVTEGHRIALTYNLVLQTNDENKVIFKTNTTNQKLKELVQQYFSLPDLRSTQKLAYFLEHQYTEKNLKWNKLKGPDQSNVAAFHNIAKQLDLTIYLALVEIEEHYTICEDEGHGNKYQYTRICPEDDSEAYKEVNLTYILDSENKVVSLGKCELKDDESFSIKGLDNIKPYKQTRSHSGNEGGEVDKWYRCTAVILWPKAKEVAMNFEMNFEDCFEELMSMINKPGNEKEVLNLVSEAKEVLGKDLTENDDYRTNIEEKINKYFKISIYIKNNEVVKSLLKDLNWCYILDEKYLKIIQELETCYGTVWLITLINVWKHDENIVYDSKVFERIKSFLLNFLESDGNLSLVTNILDSLCSEIIKYDNQKPKYSWSKRSFEDKKITNLDNLLTVIVRIQDTSILKKILEHVITQPIFYPVIKLVEIFLKYRNIVSADYFENFGILKNTLVEGIDSQLPKLINDLDDWSIQGSLYCNCEHCKIINEFLHSKNEKEKFLNTTNMEKDFSHISQRLGTYYPVEIKKGKAGSVHKLKLIKKDSMHDKKRDELQKFKEARSKLADM